MDRLSNHISELGFKNYRVFDNNDLYKIELKPITFITGANSSGKSSIFKALMLLEENRKANNLFELMFFSGTHILGSISGIQNEENKPIIFSVTRKNRHNENVSLELEYNLDGLLVKAALQSNQKDLIRLSYTFEDKYNIELKLDIFANSELRENIQFSDIYDNNTKIKLTLLVENNWQEWVEILKETQIYNEVTQRKQDYITEEKEKLFIATNRVLVEAGFNSMEVNSSPTTQLSYIEDEERINEFMKIVNDFEEDSNLILAIANSKEAEFQEEIEKEESEASEASRKSKQDYINGFVNDIQNKIINHQLNILTNNDIQEGNKLDVLYTVKTVILNEMRENLFFFNEDEELNDIGKFLPIPEIQEIAQRNYTKDFSTAFFDKNIHKTFYQRLIGDYLDMFFIQSAPFFHIPVDRGRQKRIITFSNQNDVLENALASINLQDNRTAKQEEFIHKWFSTDKFDIGYDYKIKKIEGKSVFFRVYKNEVDFNNEVEEKGKTLADLGLGISQLMPIILSCINPNNEGKTIFIEEPETNLHPKFQSLLAEMFVDTAEKFNIQFVIETHSEYLIRKMQELVANEKIDKDDSVIYYFRSSSHTLEAEERRFEKIEFKEKGIIDYHKFGEGFYDTDYSLEFGLLNMQARILFKKMYEDLEEKDEEERIRIIGERIDHYAQIQDLSKWEDELKIEIAGFDNLNSKTKYYLKSAYFFIGMFDKNKIESAEHNNIDFAPIIVQLGRAIETELQKVFSAVVPVPNCRIDFNYMQQKLEKNNIDSNIKTAFEISINNMEVFIDFIKNTVITSPSPIKNIREYSSLLGIIRTYRNSAAHENHTATGLITYDTLDNYQKLTIFFFQKWCSYLKI